MDNTIGQIFQDKAKIREIVQKSLMPTNHSVYLHLLDHMRSISKEYLKHWLGALQDCLSLINIKTHDELLNVIWSFDWYMEDNETVRVYMDFVAHLISSQTGFLFGCFTMISRNFGVYYEKEKLRSSEEVNSLLHQLLKSLIEIVPSSLNLLSKCIVSGFPHISSSTIEQSNNVILYVNNILFLTTYCPSLKESVFEVIFDKINQLDALLPSNNKLIEEEELFAFEEDQEHSKKQEYNRNIFIMDKIISSVNNYIYSNSSNLVQRDEIMDILLRLFDTKVLTTYKSKYIQLILFYLTSLSPNYHVRFLSNLFEKFLDSRVHIKTRESAVNYVASYLCRANFILIETIKNSIGLLITQLHNYVDTFKSNSSYLTPPTIVLNSSATHTLNPPAQHTLFYTTCQSVLYILCFLYDELLLNGLDHEYFISLNLEKLIKSSFNPIYYCSVDIVDALSDKIHSFGLSECRDMILNCNKITRVYEDNPIDTHFPFDPYYSVLPNVKALISPIYNNWEELGGSRNSIKRRESIAYSDSSSLPSMSLDQSGSLDPHNFLHNSTGSLTPNYYSFSLNNNSFRGNLSSSYDSM